MVYENQLRAFEKKLLELGNERSILEKEGRRVFSVFDSQENTAERQRSILENLISKAVESEQTNEYEARGERVSESDTTVDEFDSLLKDANVLEAISSDASEDIDDDIPVEVIEDNIDFIEQGIDDDEDIVVDVPISRDFALPTAYQSLSTGDSFLSYEAVFSMGVSQREYSKRPKSEVESLLVDDTLRAIDDDRLYKDKGYKSLRSFSPDDESLFFENLNTYNIVIKKAVFAILMDEKISHFAERLVDFIFDSAPSNVIHRECEKLLKIMLPSPVDVTVYTHETLAERLHTSFESVTKSVNVFMRRIIPLVAGVSLAVFFGFFFVVQPIRAFVYYKLGFNALQNYDYEKSEKRFIKASDIWSMERFYFSYADEYEQHRRYDDAKKKYLQLVFGLDDNLRAYMQRLTLEKRLFTTILVNDAFMPAENIVHYSRKGFLNLAAFTRDIEGDFEEADTYYNTWLLKYVNDSDFYIELGNTYVEWYDMALESTMLEKARFFYDKATVLRNNDDMSLIVRIRYAVRAGDDAYITSIHKGILFAPTNNKPRLIFVPYVELAMYKLEHHKPSYVGEILDLIKTYDPEYIDLHYLYAQYYFHIGYDGPRYQEALLQAQNTYANRKVLRGKTLYYAIDTNILLGNLLLKKYDNVIYAKESLLRAQKYYEDMHFLLSEVQIKTLARLYELQAEVAILENDLALARKYIEKAQEYDYNSATLMYQQGVIEYTSQNYGEAAQYFLRIVDGYMTPVKRKISTSVPSVVDAFEYTADIRRGERVLGEHKSDILFATANALYLSGNYSAAALYFEKALADMEEIDALLANTISFDTDNNADEISNARSIVLLRNNLGVALYRLSEQHYNDSKFLYARAMNELTSANRIVQNTYRTSVNHSRKIIPNLPEANISAIVHDSRSVQIYHGILLSVHSPTARYYNQTLHLINGDFSR